MKHLLFLIVILNLSSVNIFSQEIPKQISFQGILKDASGNLLTGDFALTFKIYNEPAGGLVLWSETQAVFVDKGLFGVLLGTSNPIASVPFDRAHYLGITIGTGSELNPRIPLSPSPYSFMSFNVLDSAITTNKIKDGAVTGVKIGSNEVVKSINGLKDDVNLIAGSNITLTSDGNNLTISTITGTTGISGSGTANYLSLFSESTKLGNSIIYQTDGNLGIGTTTPTVKLELDSSDAKIYGLTIGRGSGSIESNNAFGYQSLYSNASGEDNIAIGHQSLYANTSGKQNTGVGHGALYSNTSGISNTAIGFGTLYNEVQGSMNTAIGYRAMYFANSNGSGPSDNTAVGANALEGSNNPSDNYGIANTAIGSGSLQANTNGTLNTAMGIASLISNITGQVNTASGAHSLYSNTSGNYNSGFGCQTLYKNKTGNYNSAVGSYAGSSLISGENNTFIGYHSQPSSTTVSNEITLGDDNITSLRCNVTSISSLSDARDKKNIRDLPLGLDFLINIKPRLFNWDKREWYKDGKSDGSKMKETPTAGFIAQELDEAQTKANAEWLNLVLKSNPERYEATAGNLLPIMVKAIQELKTENDSLKNELEEMRRSMAEVKETLLKLENTKNTKSQFTLSKTEEWK